MTNTIIQVENLSKRYRIGTRDNGYKTFREAILDGFTAPIRNFKRLRKLSRFDDTPLADNNELTTNNQKSTPDNRQHITDNSSQSDVIWALKDVSFEVKQGDVVGIIGRNGSGKSTLLKILSRITEPTSGEVKLHGRVSSLLEVGTGFHPELTGRENIYLNSAILGMRKTEIEKKFDEIVSFAEIEKFIDTPVKRYSSGMYVRLAFAVAAYLEPDILLVDEVLAVGDAQFQKKCIEKMEDSATEGRTVLFVSHNMAMISNLCRKGIVLDAGKQIFQGDISTTIIKYYQNAVKKEGKPEGRFEGEIAGLLGAELIGLGHGFDITIHDELVVHMKYKIKKYVAGKCVPNFHFFTPDGNYAFISAADNITAMPPGEYYAECRIPSDMLNEGAYFVGIAVTTHYDKGGFNTEFFNNNALMFNVIDPMDERSNRYGYAGPIPGAVRPKLKWKISKDI
jgi:lipopolysaccharide transport system ATP-binding protein